MNGYEEVLEVLGRKTPKSDELLNLLNSEISMPNIKSPTMGGHVFWTDIVEYNGWRLQQNDITHHARILDDNDVRIAWGTINGMYRALDRLAAGLHRYEKPESSSSERIGKMDELKHLKELLDLGAITETEYESKKAEILKKI